MTRPAIIIGLGGTGQWVLTFVKKDLLEVGRGSLPSNVALLSFDTMPQATAEAERQGGEREVKVGSVRLVTDKEFIHLGGNVYRLAEQISKRQHPHIGSWFQADHYLRALPPAAFNLSEGAGTIRQFGRLAVFNDLSQPAESRIWPNVYSAVQRIRSSVSDESALEVIIVGSFAGGTGAGMFIDMALLLRAIATDAVAGNHMVRGFFVLPRAFPVMTGRRQTEMFARTFAAWRELNRFMIVDPELGLRRMVYNERNRDYQVPVQKRAYDVCYLLDAMSDRASLATQSPEKGIFPSIADAIGAILDTTAGKKYTEHVTANLSRSFNNHPGQPMYSTFGTYSVKVPVYYVQQEFAHQLAISMLDHILSPIRDEKQRITQLRPNANPEKPGRAGAEEVYAFMEGSSFSRAGEETVFNTLFLPKVAELIRKNADVNPDMINIWAGASLFARKGNSPIGWLTPFSQLGDSPQAIALRSDIDKALYLRLVQGVPPSRQAGDKPADAIARLQRQVPDFKTTQVGVKDVGGQAVSRGIFGKTLDECKKFQITVFERSLRLWLLNTLEGQTDDPLVGRVGKVGYAQSFIDELVKVMDRFLNFLRKVDRARQDSGQSNRMAQEVTARWRACIQRANNPGGLISRFLTKEDLQAQERYLDAEQRAIDLRQDEIIQEVVTEAAQATLEIVKQLRDEVRRWVETLALNPDSIAARVASSRDESRVAHGNDKGLANVQRILADHALAIPDAVIREALKTWRWEVNRKDAGFAINCVLDMGSRVDLSVAPLLAVQSILEYSASKFPAFKDKSVAIELAQEYKYDYKQIAGALDKKAEPLSRIIGTGPEEKHCYIRVKSNQSEQIQAIFDETIKELKSLNAGVSMQLVDSEDPFRLTVVRSNDMIKPEDFRAWEECQNAYVELIHDEPEQAARLQTFPAEVIAAKYERQLERLRANWRTFHPQVVMLLEDENKTRQFLKAWTYGLIQAERDPKTAREYYELVIPGTNVQPIHLTEPEHGKDVFRMMNQFLLRGDDARRTLRQPIRFDWLQESLDAKQRELGNDVVVHMFEDQIQNGFVATHRQQGARLEHDNPGSGQHFLDLADLVELVLRNMSAELIS